MPSTSLHDQFTKDALLIIWDILSTDDDPARAQKLDQLRRCLEAIEVPKTTARKAREKVDARLKTPVLTELDEDEGNP